MGDKANDRTPESNVEGPREDRFDSYTYLGDRQRAFEERKRFFKPMGTEEFLGFCGSWEDSSRDMLTDGAARLHATQLHSNISDEANKMAFLEALCHALESETSFTLRWAKLQRTRG
jgi:hypothetical protein